MKVLVLLLLKTLSVQAEIDRRDGATNHFHVVNHGRMYWFNVIMFLEETSLHECTNYCVMHLQCNSVSYSSSARLCELNDVEFDGFEADKDAIGWINYGTPARIDGGFSDWKNITGCSKSCGYGHVTYIRSCDNPKPQHAGEDCVGNVRKIEPCLIKHCPVNGGFSDWKNVTGCSKSCGHGQIKYFRSCDNPEPKHGGRDCVGEKIKIEPCHTRICPVCYGARKGEHGKFKVPKSGSTKEIRLTHISGGLMCDATYGESNWGCSYIIHALKNKVAFTTYVTDESKNVLFPQGSRGFYNIDGKSIYDAELTLIRNASINVAADQTLRMYYGEDLFDIMPHDNSGRQCIYVEIIYD